MISHISSAHLKFLGPIKQNAEDSIEVQKFMFFPQYKFNLAATAGLLYDTRGLVWYVFAVISLAITGSARDGAV